MYFACPDVCRVVELSDFIDGTAEKVVENLSELFSGQIDIQLIDGDYDADWSDEEQMIELKLEINGEKVVINYSSNIADDPLALTDHVISSVALKEGVIKTEIIATRTIYNVWEEDGAALMIRLPSEVRQKLDDLLS